MILLATLLGSLTGCFPEVNINDPVADLYAADYARRASLSVRLASGAGALVSEVCFIGQDGWSDLAASKEGIDPGTQVASLLGLQGDGDLTYDQETGGVLVKWEGAEIDDGITGTITLTVRRATETFGVSFSPDTTPIDEDEPEGPAEVSEEAAAIGFTSAAATVDVTGCGGDGANSAIEVDFNMPELIEYDEDGEALPQALVIMPSSDDLDAVVWSKGEPWPDEGDFFWTYGAGVDRQQIYGYDASEISGESWPAQAEGASSWIRDVDVPLTRGVR